MRPKTYTDKRLQILKAYYPSGNWEAIMPFFPGKGKADIRAIARKNNIKREREFAKDKDLTGQRFGKLTVISKAREEDRVVYWTCLCDCGNETVVDVYRLINGQTLSCGCLKHKRAYNAKDFTGKKFGLLTVVERLEHYRGKETFYRCKCECGRERIVYSGNLSSGHTRACGIINHKKKEYSPFSSEHDDTNRIYSVYRHISPNGKSYIGITKQNPKRRFQNGFGYKTQIAFCRAIEKYGWENFQHEILETNLTEKEACEKEAYYIEKVYKSIVPNGYNTREGGITGKITVMPVVQYYKEVPVNFFESITIASKELGIAQKTITIHCGKENAVNGYYFAKLERIAPYNIPEEYLEMRNEAHISAVKNIIAKDMHDKTVSRNKKTAKAVNQYDLKGHYIRTYPSIVEAKKTIGWSDGGAIEAAVNPKREGYTAYNYIWKYDNGDHSDIEPIKYKAQKAIVKIDCVSGELVHEYKSIAEASRELGAHPGKIKRACGGDDSIFEGFRIRYRD